MSMLFKTDTFYHIYNRGNNRKQVFYKDEHYMFFLKKFRNYCLPYCKVVAYCLMPNHFHFMIYTNAKTETQSNKLNNNIGTLLSSYTQAVNKQCRWTGSLFQASTKAKELSGSNHLYPQTCFHYIHQNPIRARLVQKMEDWKYSSYRDYAGLRYGSLPDKYFTFRWLDITDSAEFVAQSLQSIDERVVDKLF